MVLLLTIITRGGRYDNSIIQSAIEQQLSEEIIEDVEKLDFNPLQVYFGDDYVVNEKITIHQPTIQDFIDYGEDKIYGVITPFITNTTACRVKLWEMGIDWNKISNQQLFATMIRNVDYEYSKIIFGDINFSTFIPCEKKHQDGSLTQILYSPVMNLEIDEETMNKMCVYIQHVFHAFPPEEEFTSSKTLKQELINNDKQKILAQQKKAKDEGHNSLLSMISFCLNHPGFKYKKNELREVCIAEFMDSVQRLQIYESTRALYNGMYSGFCDLSKINKNEFNFMRDGKITA